MGFGFLYHVVPSLPLQHQFLPVFLIYHFRVITNIFHFILGLSVSPLPIGFLSNILFAILDASVLRL